MAEAIFLAGKRGSGKSLGAMHLIEQYIKEGRLVATNLDIYIEHLASPLSKTPIIRLPDCPTGEVLESMPHGNPDPTNEKRNGLLVLDEIAAFLNSREWQGKERNAILVWLAQSRKYGWDLLLLGQHSDQLDAQIRKSLIDIQGTVRNLEKVRVPVIGGIWKHFTGKALMMPKVHVVNLFYGFGQKPPLSDRMVYRGQHLFKAYNTLQKISAEFGNQHMYTLLPAWHVKGRYMKKWDLIRHAGAAGAVLGLLSGLIIGASVTAYLDSKKPQEGPIAEAVDTVTKVVGVISGVGMPKVVLSDGRVVTATKAKYEHDGDHYLIDGKWVGASR